MGILLFVCLFVCRVLNSHFLQSKFPDKVKLKMSDIGGMVELCSAIHQKYAEFSGCLVENWTRMLTLKKDEKVANPSKMRVDLR